MDPVAFVLKGYPRLSETFIAQEIAALEAAGLPIRIVSLRRPTDWLLHPVHRAIRAPVHYLPEYLHDAPLRVLRAWRRARRLPGYRAARAAWLRDLRRDPTRSRIRRFGQALVLACEGGADLRHLHAHFLHTPASVTRYAAALRGLAWTVSAHAKDIWTIPDWEKREKLADCRWAVTCTAEGHRHLAGLAPQADIALVRHGIDFRRFPPAPAAAAPASDGADPERPLRLLAVGRAVPKKGFGDLVEALALLPPELHWRLVHVGGGALTGTLRKAAARLGVAGRIEWRGAQAQEAVLAACREADLFVLPSRIARDGDRDGLPNVLMEAQSQGVCCLATTLPGIAELITDGMTGLLVPPGDPAALARAIGRLAADTALRARLAAAGEARVRREFGMAEGVAALAARFGLPGAPAVRAAS